MTKRMGFIKSDLKSAKSTVSGRMVPKEWDFVFYQLYRFQKMPKGIRPKSRNIFVISSFCAIPPSSKLYFSCVTTVGCHSYLIPLITGWYRLQGNLQVACLFIDVFCKFLTLRSYRATKMSELRNSVTRNTQ